MLVPTRNFQSPAYRYGFQGQEKDDEIKGNGNSLNYKFRMHDPRVGRFFAVDPLSKTFPWNSPYAFSENRVVDMKELEGAEITGAISDSFKMAVGKEAIKKTKSLQIIDRTLDNVADRTDTFRVSKNIFKSFQNDPNGTMLRINPMTGAYLALYDLYKGFKKDVEAIQGNSETTTPTQGKVDLFFHTVDGALIVYGSSKAFSKSPPKGKIRSIGAKAKKGVRVKLIDEYKIESSLSRKPARAHGYKWSDADAIARAKYKKTVQGRFGSKKDVDYAIEQAQQLQIGERKLIPANTGNNNIIIDENGMKTKATHIFIEVKPSGNTGTIHAFPVQADYNIRQRATTTTTTTTTNSNGE